MLWAKPSPLPALDRSQTQGINNSFLEDSYESQQLLGTQGLILSGSKRSWKMAPTPSPL